MRRLLSLRLACSFFYVVGNYIVFYTVETMYETTLLKLALAYLPLGHLGHAHPSFGPSTMGQRGGQGSSTENVATMILLSTTMPRTIVTCSFECS